MNQKKLRLAQLERKLNGYIEARKVTVPPVGWIKTVRVSLGMSLQQLADRLGISKQSVQEMEVREQEDTISLKNLKEAARALDMELVYALVPKDGSLEALIDRKARELATEIVMRTSVTMKLEDQENSPQRLDQSIEERTAAIKYELPKHLWD